MVIGAMELTSYRLADMILRNIISSEWSEMVDRSCQTGCSPCVGRFMVTNRAASQEEGASPETLRERTLDNIQKLQSLFTRELLVFALFVVISVGALNDFSFLGNINEAMRTKLGAAPPVNLISLALVIYLFAAVILVLARMMSGSDKYGGMSHVGYLTGFYLFYHFAGALRENFWAVFAGGITVMALESYHLWTYCSEEIEKEKEVLASLERNAG